MSKFLYTTAAALFAACGLAAAPAHAGMVTVYDNSAPTCREFTSTITVGNTLQQGVGTACQQGDGSWQIVSGPGVGTSFYDNGIPVAYPANNYVASNTGYYNDVYYGRPVYYQQPVRVRYIFAGARYYNPPPVIVTQIGGPRYYPPRHYGHEYGWGNPHRDWDNGPRRDRDGDRRHGH